MNLRIALVFLFGSLIFSCSNKYEEGPFLSVFPAKERLARNWNWVLARRTSNGVTENLSSRLTGSSFQFNDDGSWNESRYGTSGTWALVSKKQELNLIFEPSGDSLGVDAQAVAFDIRQLTKNDLWLIFEDTVEVLEWQLKAE
ncbi:MAG: hypothetical protein AB8F95_09785 [Bacteroidia bacterium]